MREDVGEAPYLKLDTCSQVGIAPFAEVEQVLLQERKLGAIHGQEGQGSTQEGDQRYAHWSVSGWST